MTKVKFKFPILTILLISAFIFSCEKDETCRKSRIVETGAGFYLDSVNTTTGKRVLVKSTIDSLWVSGIGVDSLLYKKTKTNAIKLPLNQFAEESKFRMKTNKVVDTITIRYKNKIEYLSLECGSIRTHTIDTVLTSGHYIRSVAIINPTVNTLSVENIQLFHTK